MSDRRTAIWTRALAALCALAIGASASAQDFPLVSSVESPGFTADVEPLTPAPGAGESEVSAVSTSALLDRVEALESSLKEMKAESLQKEIEKLKKPTFQIGGRIQFDNWTFPDSSAGIGYFEHPVMGTPNYGADPENRWAFRRLRLEMQGEIPDDLFWRFQVDFAQPQNPAFKDVYIGYSRLPFNQRILLGNHKRPVGLDSWNSSRFNTFMERPFIIATNNPGNRRPGLAVWGHNDEESVFWQYGTYLMENNDRTGNQAGDKIQLSLNGRIGGSPWYVDEANWSHWAVSGMVSYPNGNPYSTGSTPNQAQFESRPEARTDNRWLNTGRILYANHFQTLGLEGMINRGPFNATAEYQQTWVNRSGGLGGLTFNGYYAEVAYFLTDGDHMSYKRNIGALNRPKINSNVVLWDRACRCEQCGRGWGGWQLAFRYSFADLNSGNVLGGMGQSYTAGVNWWWSPYARIQFNAIRGFISGHQPIGGYTAGSYTILGTRFAVDF